MLYLPKARARRPVLVDEGLNGLLVARLVENHQTALFLLGCALDFGKIRTKMPSHLLAGSLNGGLPGEVRFPHDDSEESNPFTRLPQETVHFSKQLLAGLTWERTPRFSIAVPDSGSPQLYELWNVGQNTSLDLVNVRGKMKGYPLKGGDAC